MHSGPQTEMKLLLQYTYKYNNFFFFEVLDLNIIVQILNINDKSTHVVDILDEHTHNYFILFTANVLYQNLRYWDVQVQ